MSSDPLLVYRSALRERRLKVDYLAIIRANLARARAYWPLPWPADTGGEPSGRSMPSDRAVAAMLCVAIGDSLGSPVEAVVPPTHITRFEPWEFCGDSGRAGSVTDDTQMTIWLARSLIACRGFDGEDLKRRFTAEAIRGIGMSTREFTIRARRGLPWYESGVSSAGNGVAMRSAPVGIMYSPDFARLVAAAGLQAMVTHNDPMAIASGVVVAAGVATLAQLRPSVFHAPKAPAAHFSRALGELIRGVEDGVEYRTRDTHRPDTLCNRLTATIPSLLDADATPAQADAELRSGGYVLESLPLALFCFLRRPSEPIASILDAVNNSYDSDTVGAMTGAFAGAMCGTAAIDPSFLADLEYRDELESLAKELCAGA